MLNPPTAIVWPATLSAGLGSLLLGCASGDVPREASTLSAPPMPSAMPAPPTALNPDPPLACASSQPLDPPIDAAAAAAGMAKGFNLGQMFDNTQHPRTLRAAQAKIDAYYARGYRNVRVPVTWTESIGGSVLADPTTGIINNGDARLAVIVEVIEYALSLPDMFVVLNAHHEKKLKTDNRLVVAETLWEQIATIFQACDQRLLFEFLNEPHTEESGNPPMPADQVRTLTASAYAKIREKNADRIVIIGGNQWFGAAEVPKVWTSLEGVGDGQDPYVMSTFHHYDPWTFSGNDQGAFDDAWTDASLTGPMETMLNWAETIGGGMPVYIGEWGVGWGDRYTAMDCNNIRAWYQKMIQFTIERGIPTSVWDDGGWFKIFDHATGDYNNNLVDCMDGDCMWSGEEQVNDGCL